MPQEISNILSLQTLEYGINGPGSANRVFVITGIAAVGMGSGQPGVNRQVFTALVGPSLAAGAFVRAVATAALAATRTYGDPANFLSIKFGVEGGRC